jgi:hypothetical protein
MRTTKKIALSLFLASGTICVYEKGYATEETLDTAELYQALSQQPNTSYDDFDTLADDIVILGISPQEPEQTSALKEWLQRTCSPLIMKYVLVKGFLRNWCYLVIGVKKLHPTR